MATETQQTKQSAFNTAIEIIKIYAGSADQKIALDTMLDLVYKKIVQLREEVQKG